MTPSCGLPARFRASIYAKLIGLIAVVVAAIVGALAIFFSVHEIGSLRDEQQARVAEHGDRLAGRLRAVATADGVLDAAAVDPDIVAIALYGDDRAVLYARGTPSQPPPPSRPPVHQVVATDDRVAAVTPTALLDGRGATLVVELSTAQLVARWRHIIATATAVGAVALMFGVLSATLIARSYVWRLRAIADVATAVSADGTAPREVRVGSQDEIGIVAEAFNRMLARLRGNQDKLSETVEELRIAEDHLARTNRELETSVEQRTAELLRTNDQLHVEMVHRSKIELELRQAQKLESVGRLAAGIAHEINTPVQFVSDSCSFLQQATGDLLRVVAGYRELVGSLADRPELVERARQMEADAELAYVEQQVPLATARALQGLVRVADIVGAMKEFAYQDRSEQAPADLNRAIASTLLVARNEYKYVADVRTELGDLPMVMCHVGELNQVVLNLVVNAAHAIEDAIRGTERRGEIVIRTRATRAFVELAISDDGCGIPHDLVDKIFDPFFTTKEIGKGTGQGLAIARSVIVDKHEGRIFVDSEVGRGTTFTIQLPVTGNSTASIEAPVLAS